MKKLQAPQTWIHLLIKYDCCVYILTSLIVPKLVSDDGFVGKSDTRSRFRLLNSFCIKIIVVIDGLLFYVFLKATRCTKLRVL